MDDSAPVPREETTQPAPAQESGDGFRAELPLAILESVRQHDRPAEVLEDEDLTASLPRRLGLTGVVDSQIHRYKVAQKRGERVSSEQVADLLRLVLRRPDSEPILRAAGHAIAEQHARGFLPSFTVLGRILPESLKARRARRRVHRLLHRIGGGVPIRVEHNPFRVEIEHPVTARVDRWGVACVLYGAAIERAVQQAAGATPHVEHESCEAKGQELCAWTVTW